MMSFRPADMPLQPRHALACHLAGLLIVLCSVIGLTATIALALHRMLAIS